MPSKAKSWSVTRTSYWPSSPAGVSSSNSLVPAEEMPPVPSETSVGAAPEPVQWGGTLAPTEPSLYGSLSSSRQNWAPDSMPSSPPGRSLIATRRVLASTKIKRSSPIAGDVTPGPDWGLFTRGTQFQPAGTLSLQAMPSWSAVARRDEISRTATVMRRTARKPERRRALVILTSPTNVYGAKQGSSLNHRRPRDAYEGRLNTKRST